MPSTPEIVVSAPKTRDRAQWSSLDETTLLRYLIEHQAEAGDGGNFKTATWQGAVAALAKNPFKGSPKTVTSCQSKWKKFKETFAVVEKASHQSGLPWDPAHGLNMDENTKPVWEEYIKKNPKLSAFRNLGWKYYEDMRQLMPSQAKGKTVYRGNAGRPALSSSNDSLSSQAKDASDEAGEFNSDPALPPSSCPVLPEPPHPTIHKPSSHSGAFTQHKSSHSGASKKRKSPVDSLISPSVSSIQPSGSSKRTRMTGPTALNRIGEELSSLNTTLRNSAEVKAQFNQQRVHKRDDEDIKSRARRQMQKEMYLDDDTLLAMMDVVSDVQVANHFLDIERASLRKRWVEQELKKIHRRLPDFTQGDTT